MPPPSTTTAAASPQAALLNFMLSPVSSTSQVSRQAHRALAWVLLLPLLVTVATGFLYRFLRNALNVDKASIHWLLDVHQLSILPESWGFKLHYVYPVLLAYFTLLIIVSGIWMAPIWPSSRKSKRWSTRTVHSWLSIIASIPLLLTTATGGLYIICRYWLALGKDTTMVLMTIHQGSYLSDAVFYTTFVFILFLPLYYTGVSMLGIRRRLKRLFVSTTPAYELTTADEAGAEMDDKDQLLGSATTPTGWQATAR